MTSGTNGLQPPFQAESPPVFFAQDAQDTSGAMVGNMESFFPALSLKAFQTKYRVDASQQEQRQRQCLQQAMINVNHELMDDDAMDDGENWVCRWVKQGYERLEDIPAPMYHWPAFEDAPTSDNDTATDAGTTDSTTTAEAEPTAPVLMSEKVFLYHSAVFANCKALLIQRYPELFFGKKNRSEKQDPDNNTSPDYWDEYRNSMHQLMGTSLVTVELI